jgi:hypothetical protein
MLLPQSTTLRADEQGIHIRQLFRTTHVDWGDIDSFQVCSLPGGLSSSQLVGIKYRPSYKGRRTLRKIAAALSGVEGAIPNTYDITPAELCRVLNDARARWGNVA